MFLKSLVVRNLLSFGPQKQELRDFKSLNLFIGVNGSGKSNVLRLLGDLKLNHEPVNRTFPRGMRQGEPAQNAQLSVASLDKTMVTNRMPHTSIKDGTGQVVYKDYSGDLRIEYLDIETVFSDEKVEHLKDFPHGIEFKNASLVEGDPAAFTRRNRFITSDWDDLKFANSLQGHGDMFQDNALLIFGLRYVFQRDYVVGSGGYFAELHTRLEDNRRSANSGPSGFDKNLWADGVLKVAKIILQLTRTSGVALLEEPELGLEPRVIRRFLNFLVWLGTPDSELDNESNATRKVHAAWENYVDDIQSSRKEAVKMPGRTSIQYFISSHSPVILSKVLELGEAATVFEFSTSWHNTSYHEADSNSGTSGLITFSKGRLIKQKSLFSRVRQISADAHLTMRSLGATGADVLQCNGVVWVEGPSDIIYIEAWLKIYAKENNFSPLIQGHNFQFQMYGGALLDSLCLQAEAQDPADEQRKLLEMLSFSRNAYIVMDSDAVKKADGTVVDQSNFAKAKSYIKHQFFELSKTGYDLGLWFADGDCELRTIEDYLDQDSKDSVPPSLPKKLAAERRVAQWSDKSLSDFPNLKDEIKRMHECILAWQPD